MRKSILCAAALLLALSTSAQGQPAGSVVYSLPQTIIRLTVEAQREAFTAGPYAQYAQKYLGVAARTSSETTYRLDKIDMVPFTEADPQYRYAVTIPEKSSINFFQFCSQGLVAIPGSFTGQGTSWSFTPQAGAERWEGIDPEGNLGTESTTLYRAVATDEGYQKVPVSQDNVVEKSLDRKAADAAEAAEAEPPPPPEAEPLPPGEEALLPPQQEEPTSADLLPDVATPAKPKKKVSPLCWWK